MDIDGILTLTTHPRTHKEGAYARLLMRSTEIRVTVMP